ncbi:tetratricopeptide repeat protein [Polynucleobacter hallstattensis]|uniref:tetratricopeptide repeat-containing glycosyltransferase family protein n=1 Tax=Polynucleobacter hallstattensis TaxID=1855586 RepID=UPI001C0B3E34|nr:tetratricopeptide repeat-containing glycosyltransferase family protein [Polynucleobacter hallstattensis]MBU3560453.1 glycosyltransferase family protein [Polynucleobacter hallstattensis]
MKKGGNLSGNRIELKKSQIEEAVALLHAGNFEDARVIYERILQEDPNDCGALNLLGLVDYSLKNYQQALILFSKAISICPHQASFHSHLGNTFKELGRYSEALESYDQAIRINPKFAQAYMNRGVLLRKQGRYAEALASFTNSIELDPNDFKIFINCGNTLRDLGKFNEALVMFDYAVNLQPDSPELFLDRANVLIDLMLISKALASYERSIYLRPDYSLAHMNKAHTLLANGQFDEGFESYEWRWRTTEFGSFIRSFPDPKSFSEPLWLGSQSLSGKTILLQAEQGIGDIIQFCRYVNPLSDLGAHVILEAPKKLVTLLNSLDGRYEVVSVDDALPHFDYRCPIMSLPRAFKTNLHNIPLSQGYLKADQKRVSQIQEEIRLKNPHSKKLCGISWLSKADKTGLFRSVHLKDFISMLAEDDLLYVNLQYGEVDEEIAQVEKDLGVTVVNLDSVNKYDDIDGLAAIIQACDLIISIDNTTVHLAGALGKDTRVLLPYVPAWRWMLGRKDSPWYQSLILYRQPAVFDWVGVFANLKEDLKVEISTYYLNC